MPIVEQERQYAAIKAHTTSKSHERRRKKVTAKQHLGDADNLRITNESRILAGPSHNRIVAELFDPLSIPGTPLLDHVIAVVRSYHDASWSSIRRVGSAEQFTQSRMLGTEAGVETIPDMLWQVFVTNAGIFCSVLASIIPIVKSTMPIGDVGELENLGLQLKATSLAHLRQTLCRAPLHSVPSLALVYHVKALFREASTSGDIDSAGRHARMLDWLVEKLPASTRSTTRLRRLALWGDAIPALLQLRRPVVEHRLWLPSLVRQIWKEADLILSQFKQAPQDQLSCIRSPPLQAAIVHVRRALEIQQACQDGHLRCSEQTFQWLITTAEFHMCCLLDLYFDLTESKIGLELTKGELHTETALTMVLLHVYQKSFSNIAGADGVDMHDSAQAVFPTLLFQTQSALACSSAFESLVYHEAHLWLLSVGVACEEQCSRSSRKQHKSCSDVTREWFRAQLDKQTSKLDPEHQRRAAFILASPTMNQISFHKFGNVP